MRRTPFRAVAVTAGALTLAVGPLTAPASAETFDIQIVGINDFHGRLEPTGTTSATSNPPAGRPVAGSKQIAGALDSLRAANERTLVVSAGDNIGASTFTSNIQQDEPTIAFLNSIGMDASAVGNHEFDKGYDDIREGGRVDGLADFPFLGANVYLDGTTTPALQEYAIASVAVGTDPALRIGFVGTVTPETPSLVSPDGISAIDFGDEATAANRVAAQLKDDNEANGEADVVIVLSHNGANMTDVASVATSSPVAEASADIDAIFQGHTHRAYNFDLVVGNGGFSGPVIQTGQYGDNLGLLNLRYDDVTDAVTFQPTTLLRMIGQPTTNEEVNRIVDEAAAFAAEAGAVELGAISTDILRAQTTDPETGELVEDRGAESVLGNFIADVHLDQTLEAGAEIAFMNPGGLREDFEIDDTFGDETCGVVTLGEANIVQPFANALVTMDLSGADIKAALEQQYQPDGSSRAFLALGVSDGLFFALDDSQPRGSRISGITLGGESLDLAATYRITVNEFLASGGDNFDAFENGTNRVQLGASDLEAITAYLDERDVATPDLEPRRTARDGGEAAPLRQTGATCPAPDEGTPPPGDDGSTPPPGGGDDGTVDDKDCADFATQAEAQAALAGGDPFNLDTDNDGVACESGVGGAAGDGGKSGAGQNRGLSVDTGVTGSDDTQMWALTGLFLVLSAGGAVAFRRRGAVH